MRLTYLNISFLISLLATVLFFSSPVLAGGGEAFFNKKGCLECHRVTGGPDETTIEAVLEKKGPELWYAGSKFRPGFIARWLTDPKPIRPMAYYSLTEKNKGDHVRLVPAEALEIAAYLMTLKSATVKPSGIRPHMNIKGKKVFGKEFSCYACHKIKNRKKVLGGLSGPSLVGTRARLNPDWIYAYLTNPRAFRPVMDMPVFAGLVSPKKISHLAEYVSSLE